MNQFKMKMNATHSSILKKIASKIYTKIGKFDVKYFASDEPIDKANATTLNYSDIKVGESWGKKEFCCAWFKLTGKKNSIKKNLYALINISGEALVYNENFDVITSITSVPNKINLFQAFKGKQIVPLDDIADDIVLYMDAGYNGFCQSSTFCPKLIRCDICEKNEDYHKLFYSYNALLAQMLSTKDKQVAKNISSALNEAKKYLNNPNQAIAILDKLLNEKDKSGIEFFAIGHGHLDLAWLWPLRETKRKAVRTIAAQIQNIDKYKGFVYGISQPQQIEWIKQYEPALFEQIKQKIKEGTIEPQGGMWTECDCNLVSGESFIRQFYYGFKYWKQELNVDVRTCWLPDVFGFSGALPQIIKKCGIDTFYTIKLSWNKVNKFPYNSFNWEGIDGTKVLAHISPFPDYTCTGSPFIFNRAVDNYKEANVAPVALISYGPGDGGCGPNEGNVEIVGNVSKMIGMPNVKFGSAVDFFDKLKKYEDKLPTHSGELYLEMHQGTFTTQAKNKKYNRKIEILLHDIEFLQSQMLLRGMDIEEYNLDEIWKEVLLYQFHDILPGSSINRVHVESQARYAIIAEQLKDTIQKITAKLGISEGLFNASCAHVDKTINMDNIAYRVTALPYSNAQISKIQNSNLSYGCDYIDNGVINVKFNKYGEIISYYNHNLKKEFANKTLNSLIVYSDPRIFFNAWDIVQCYEKLPKHRCKLVESVTMQNADNITKVNTYRYNKSKIRQKVIVYANRAEIDFITNVDWNEKHKMLRADFYPNHYGDKVVCDCQFGYKEYNTTNNNSFDKAKFEINAHKFIDVSKDGYGVALFNDCKYGHGVKNGRISLNLLRSPVYPDPKADRGQHEFKYSLLAYSGNMNEANIQNFAYQYNNELLPISLNISHIISVNNANIVVETIKPSYDKKAIVVRLYERSGQEQKTTINTFSNDIFETNMLENNEKKIDCNLTFHKFEVKTLKIMIK